MPPEKNESSRFAWTKHDRPRMSGCICLHTQRQYIFQSFATTVLGRAACWIYRPLVSVRHALCLPHSINTGASSPGIACFHHFICLSLPLLLSSLSLSLVLKAFVSLLFPNPWLSKPVKVIISNPGWEMEERRHRRLILIQQPLICRKNLEKEKKSILLWPPPPFFSQGVTAEGSSTYLIWQIFAPGAPKRIHVSLRTKLGSFAL